MEAKRLDIQGLRAIAVVLVVLFHLELGVFRGGYVGVDIFFTISGYLISGIIYKELIKTGSYSFANFAARRLKRLLPTLLVVLVSSLITSFYILSSYEHQNLTSSFPYAVTWVSNFFYAFSNIDYFTEFSERDLFKHTWSLSVEEQFYLFWPLLLFATYKLTSGNSVDIVKRRIGLAILALLVGSLCLSVLVTSLYPKHSFYLVPTRIWEFAAGGVIFIFSEHKTLPKKTGKTFLYQLISLSAIAAIIACSYIYTNRISYPGYWAVVPVLSTAILLYTSGSQINKLIGNKLFTWIGDRSYSIYLWHWPLIIIALQIGLFSTPRDKILIALLTLALSVISYRTVELPFWKGSLGSTDSKPIISFSLFAILASLLVFNSLPNKSDSLWQDPKVRRYQAARNDKPDIYSEDCDSWYHSSELKPCTSGATDYKNTAVIIGDSIGAQWYSAIKGAFDLSKWRIVTLTKSSCPIIDENYFYTRINAKFTICNEWRKEVLEALPTFRADLIFIGSSSTYPFTRSQWINGTKRMLAPISKATKTTVIIPGTPWLSFDGPNCLIRNRGGLIYSQCSEEMFTDKSRQVASYLEHAAEGVENTQVLNLNELVCPNNVCSAENSNDVVVFRDNMHLTDTFAKQTSKNIRFELFGGTRDSHPSGD